MVIIKTPQAPVELFENHTLVSSLLFPLIRAGAKERFILSPRISKP